MASGSYGSMDEEKLMSKHDDNSITLNILEVKDVFPDNPFGEIFDAAFWEAVNDSYKDGNNGKSWALAITDVRVSVLKSKYKKTGKDVLVGLLQDTFDQYKAEAEKHCMTDLMPSFIQQVSEFAAVIINEDYLISQETGKKSTYSKLLKCGDNGIKKTALYLTCERDLVAIAELLLSLYPAQIYIKCSSGDNLKQIPLETAIERRYDVIASVLVKQMINERVRQLFEYDEVIGKAKFSFSELTGNINMKKTVLAILDCLINSDFPYIPVQPGEEQEAAWSKIPDLPMRYHIYYQLLDGDDKGRPAQIKDLTTGKYIHNEAFNHNTPSGLYLIANSPFNSDIIGHPAVRLLIRRKWALFGRQTSRKYFYIYLLYLLMMSLSFFLGVQNNNRSTYNVPLDYVRAVCEIVTYVIAVFYLISEISQMAKERKLYFKDIYNQIDLLGLFFILLIPFIKWTTGLTYNRDPSRIEWSIASVAFLINFIRVFKYFDTFKTLGVYTNTFLQIVYYDISKFLIVYAVIFFGFGGSVYLAIKAEANGLSKVNLTPFTILLQEIRALAETNGFADEYVGNYRVGVIILLMINMFVVIVILSNILIGQISYRYEKANDLAFVSYDIARAKTVTKIENSRFILFNNRIKYYVDGDYITQAQVVDELAEDWERMEGTRKGNNATERIRSLMGKIIQKKNS